MNVVIKPRTLFAFLVAFTFCFKDFASPQPLDFYTQGIRQKEDGHWQQALKIWRAARDSSSRSDPRIGIAFIELVTDKRATDYYEDASSMYFWGLSNYDLKTHRTTIRAEIERMAPLLSERDQRIWQKLLNKSDPAINDKIKEFWTKKDPIPTSEINERLIEHWERISYIKEKFQREQTTVYGTDDRGLVFIKYGAPDNLHAGKLGTSLQEIMRWFDDFAIRQEIQRFNRVPEFEIWIYRGLREKESTIFLFGRRGGLAKYGLRNGLEDLISERAFSRGSTATTRGVLPGAVLQLMYYGELAGVDQFYLDRYRELEALWANARAGGRLAPDYDFFKGTLNHYRSQDKARKEFKFLPADQTDALEGLEALQLKYRLFRYLDEKNRPWIILAAVATSRDYDDLDFTPYFRDAEKSKYKQRFVLIGYDSNWQVAEKIIEYPALRNSNTAVFKIAHDARLRNYVLVAEKTLLGARLAEIQESDIPDTAKVIGIGSHFLGEVSAIDSAKTKLQASDVLLGVKLPARFDVNTFPFAILPKDPVRNSDRVQLYVELYHVNANEQRPAKVTLRYRIDRIENGEKLKQFEKKIDVVLKSERSKKTLPLNLTPLAPGNHQLSVEIMEEGAKEKQIRTSTFRIKE